MATMKNIAKSATDSVDAAALGNVRVGGCSLKSARTTYYSTQFLEVVLVITCRYNCCIEQPSSASKSVSAQSNPAPAEANILHVGGINDTISLSHLPISPPVFQKGLKMAEKSPHFLSRRPRRKFSRCRSSFEGRMNV